MNVLQASALTCWSGPKTIRYRIRLPDRKLNFHFDRNAVFTRNHTCTLINASMNYVCLGLPLSTDSNFNVNWWVEWRMCVRARHSYVWSVEWWFCMSLGNMWIEWEKKNKTHDSWRKRKTFAQIQNGEMLHEWSSLWYGIASATFKVSFSQITNIISVIFSFAALLFGWIVKMCY